MTPKLLPTLRLLLDYSLFSDYSQMTPRGLPEYYLTKPILRILPDYSSSKMTPGLLQFLDDSQTAALPILRLLPDYSQTTPILR